MIGSLAAIAVLGTLAWMQNMMTAPIGVGWMYFAMLMSLALIVPFGLIIFNLVATMIGGALRIRAALRFALGAISIASIGLASEILHSMVAVAWQLKNTTDATAATHYALIGGAVFGGFAALHFWYPKITGRTMGESLSRLSFWTMFVGVNVTFFPLFLAGLKGQVVDGYKYFSGTGVSADNLIATIGAFILAVGIILTLVNARDQPAWRPGCRARSLARRDARVVRPLSSPAAQLRRPARRTQPPAAARHPRRDRRSRRQPLPRLKASRNR